MKAAIIPARGGSKRIPGKNVKKFCGKPIIQYSVQAALDAGVFDVVTVSTDSEEIAEAAVSAGAELFFMRPPELASDAACIIPVLEHAVNCLMEQGMDVKDFCCIQATAPLLQPSYIKKGLEILIENQVSSVFSVTTFPFTIFRALRLNDGGRLEMIWPEHEHSHSNDLPEAYHDAGQFYWLNTEKFLAIKHIYAPDSMPVILPRYLVQDIDTPEDWETAEMLYQAVQTRSLQDASA